MDQGKLKIMLVSKRLSSYPWGTGNFFHKALISLGHTVVDIDIAQVKNNLNVKDIAEIQQRLGVDLLLVLKGQGMDPKWIMAVKCPTVLWYPDDVFSLPVARADLKSYGSVYDHVYYFDEAGLGELKKLGVRDPKLLLPATDPEVYVHQPTTKKVHDISFVGNIFPARRQLLDRLKKKFQVYEAQVYMHTMISIFNGSKIVFNLGIGKTGYQLRVFEALGMKCFVLTNSVPSQFRVFEDRKHLVYFTNDNVEELIGYYLAHDEERNTIAQNGYEEVLQKHTFGLRVEQLLEEVL